MDDEFYKNLKKNLQKEKWEKEKNEWEKSERFRKDHEKMMKEKKDLEERIDRKIFDLDKKKCLSCRRNNKQFVRLEDLVYQGWNKKGSD